MGQATRPDPPPVPLRFGYVWRPRPCTDTDVAPLHSRALLCAWANSTGEGRHGTPLVNQRWPSSDGTRRVDWRPACPDCSGWRWTEDGQVWRWEQAPIILPATDGQEAVVRRD